MNLNIEANKKFLLAIGVGLSVLLLGLGYDSSLRSSAATTSAKSADLEEELEEAKSKFLGFESIAESKNRILKTEFLPAMKAKLQFPDTLPKVHEGLDPAVQLREELTRIQRDAENDAARANMGIPGRDWDIGDKIKKRNTPREIAELRLRLSVTRAFVTRCIKSNMRRISKIEQKKATIEVIEDTPTVVRRVPVFVEFEGELSAIASVMLAFQREKSFLEVQSSQFRETGEPGMLNAKVQFAALMLLDRSKVKETEIESSKPVRRAPQDSRTPGRVRRRY